MRKAFDLRPLDFNDVLSRSFSLFMANFVGLLRWFLLTWLAPVLAVAVIFYFALQPHNAVGRGVEDASAFSLTSYAAYFWLVRVVSISLAFSVGAAGIYYMTARVYVGDRPGFKEVVNAVTSRMNHMVGASLLFVLGFLFITFICIVPPLILGHHDEIGMALLWGTFGWCGYVPLIMWYFGRFGLNVPSTMLDDAQTGESFARSSYLTKRFRMRFAGVLIVTALVVGLPGLPGLLTFPALIGQALLENQDLPFLGEMLRLVWESVLLPLFFIPPVVFYFDMRCRKEGYDLTVMARNFGIAEGEMQRYRFNPDLGYTPKGWTGSRARRQKVIRKPQVRTAAARLAHQGVSPAPGPWGPQPGMPGGFPGAPLGGAQARHQAPNQWQNQPPGSFPQQGPPSQGGFDQHGGPVNQQPAPNPNAPPLPGWNQGAR